ncbi:hypothetical protein [Carnobacterium maltaromaticum]|jgi:hypothetical protein|uniref:Uncharacterized protein n=1 Tax=Carnobacterium maltaromaticum LMA28 TaxID=1234679 RepID=K8ENU5_CARML|nr:hypothetical protein [Carnobacterium maltaromaticum]AOA01164.1 hypothetical protein BFC23_00950 [Carnobacterium maltaromaticum]KRN63058.1 hypothetical protein IV70_GL003397 [Carnobacterium maltaromaticum DSM 20342]CCO10171.2 hypothetical protein BN424_707 [Carnobacterium maltaromaticum LMA28]
MNVKKGFITFRDIFMLFNKFREQIELVLKRFYFYFSHHLFLQEEKNEILINDKVCYSENKFWGKLVLDSFF